MSPRQQQKLLIGLLTVVIGLFLIYSQRQNETENVPQKNPPPGDMSSGAQGSYLFCFWNVENLFDDQDDHLQSEGDKEYDPWLAGNPQVLQLKLGKLAEALLKLNDGRGPDILAAAEVESPRAAELLKDALNARLSDPALHYRHVLMKEVKVGRHIAPTIITRLPVIGDRTKQLNKTLRILEGHILVNGHQLVVVASHWTSRLSGGEAGRDKYGDAIYGEFKAMYLSNPAIDFLVCGDFNDTPEDRSVTEHLRAIGDLQSVLKPVGDPRLFNLMAGKDPATYGTHFHQGKWLIFDQIAVSPGLLDQFGWVCDPASVQAIRSLSRPGDKQHRPWRFGGPNDPDATRGYSDHFAVTVRLTVQAPVAAAAR